MFSVQSFLSWVSSQDRSKALYTLMVLLGSTLPTYINCHDNIHKGFREVFTGRMSFLSAKQHRQSNEGKSQASQQDKVQFQDQLFTKFQDNLRTFFDHKQLNTHSKCTFSLTKIIYEDHYWIMQSKILLARLQDNQRQQYPSNNDLYCQTQTVTMIAWCRKSQ